VCAAGSITVGVGTQARPTLRISLVNHTENYENKMIYLYCMHLVGCYILVFLMYQ
jgi:hypothetical protein